MFGRCHGSDWGRYSIHRARASKQAGNNIKGLFGGHHHESVVPKAIPVLHASARTPPYFQTFPTRIPKISHTGIEIRIAHTIPFTVLTDFSSFLV